MVEKILLTAVTPVRGAATPLIDGCPVAGSQV